MLFMAEEIEKIYIIPLKKKVFYLQRQHQLQ